MIAPDAGLRPDVAGSLGLRPDVVAADTLEFFVVNLPAGAQDLRQDSHALLVTPDERAQYNALGNGEAAAETLPAHPRDDVLAPPLEESEADALDGTETIDEPATTTPITSAPSTDADGDGNADHGSDQRLATLAEQFEPGTPERDFWTEVVTLHEQLSQDPELRPHALDAAIAWAAAGAAALTAQPLLLAASAFTHTAPGPRPSEPGFRVNLEQQATRALIVALEQRGSALRAAGGSRG